MDYRHWVTRRPAALAAVVVGLLTLLTASTLMLELGVAPFVR